MSSPFITGLDVGTSSFKVVVVENKGGKPVLRAVFREPASGLRKGAIVELAEVSQALSRVIAEVKKVSRTAAKNIYANIGTPQIKVQPSRGIVAVSRADAEIYQDDIEKAVKASQAINLPPNRTIIHTIIREFIVDGVGDIADPLGLSGNRLEVNSLLVDAFSPHVKNLVRAIELAGGEVGGLVFSPLVASRAALSRAQKDLGTVLIDIGAGTTGIGIYEESKLIGLGKIPVGSAHATNDVAVGLKIPVDAAENVKLGHGHAFSREVSAREAVDLKQFYPEAKGSTSKKFLAEILEARLAEIFEFVNNELKLLGKHGELPGGAVLVGGGAKLPGVTELARQELKLPSQIGVALSGEWEEGGEQFGEFMQDPEFAVAAGLALWGIDNEGWAKRSSSTPFNLRNALKYFIP